MATRKAWPLQVMGGKFLVVRREDLRPVESAIAPEMAWKIFERAFTHPHDLIQLAAIGDAACPGAIRSQHQLRQSVLRKAIYEGSLALLVRAKPIASREVDFGPPVAQQLKEARLVTTWVDMELVDMTGKPVPGAKYLCMLPDGTMRDGALDARGRVRFDGIQPGTCVFTFPELDADAWERVL